MKKSEFNENEATYNEVVGKCLWDPEFKRVSRGYPLKPGPAV